MEIPNIVKAVTAVKEKKIVKYPTDVNRASSIGYFVPELEGCLRRGVYERTNWEDKEMHDVTSQFIFDEGNNQEQQVFRDLSEAGIVVINQAQTFTLYDPRNGNDKKVLLRGSIDGKISIGNVAGHAEHVITCEVKSMNPNIFSQMNEFEDFRKKPWTLAYMAQIMAYMLGENEEVGIFILKDKSNGTLKQIEVPLDYELGEAVMRTAEQINDHVDAGTLPEKIENVDKCRMCSFKKLCRPEVDWEVGPAIADDPILEQTIDQYMLPATIEGSMEEIKKEAEKLYKTKIAPKLKVSAQQNNGTINIKLGKYLLTGKTASNGTFRPKIKLAPEDE